MCASTLLRARCGFALALLVLSLSQIAVAQTSTRVVKAPPPPGKLVDVGGWRLHLNCTGRITERGPTVVLESGAGDFSFDWSLVQPGVSSITRVCSYDRAGNAWSDLGPRPRSMKQIAYELHTALRKTGNKRPYVLVGQSIGGLLIRTFAGLYPKEVAGIVLVDSTHEDTTLFINGKVQRMRELSQRRTIPPIQKTIPVSDKTLAPEERQKLEEFLKQIGPPKIDPPYDQSPQRVQEMRLWAKAQPQHYEADNDPYWGEEFAEFYASRKAQPYPLGETPLIVLTRGKREYPDTEAGTKLNDDRKRMQLDLLNLSRNSKQIIATTSGHHIQLDDPKLVIDAIRQVVEAVRRRAKM